MPAMTFAGAANSMRLLSWIPAEAPTTIAEVGGKAYPLVRMTEAGLPVPPGAVLTTHFFSPWIDEIKSSAAWRTFANAKCDRWASLFAEL